jgi:uncharacterized membrane protein
MAEVTGRQNRYAFLDIIRGSAILLMIVYHFSWDLTFFGLADFRIFTDPKWIWFANIIVIMILGVMGISQVMARRSIFTIRKFLFRFGKIATAAAAVSLATWWMDPGTYVFFGILHHITIASVLLAGAVLLPSWLLVLMTMFVFSAPFFLVHDLFAPGWLLWLGLSPSPAAAVDYVPLFPWFAIPLSGVVVGRWLVASDRAAGVFTWQSQNRLAHFVRFVGRHSLAIYLTHQPVLYGGLLLVVSLS